MSKNIEESSTVFGDLKDSLTYTNTIAMSGVRDGLISRAETIGKNSKKGSGKKTFESQVHTFPIQTIAEEQKGQYSSLGSKSNIHAGQLIVNGVEHTAEYRYSSGRKTNHFNQEEARDSAGSRPDLIKIENLYATHNSSTEGVQGANKVRKSYFQSKKYTDEQATQDRFKSVPLIIQTDETSGVNEYSSTGGVKIRLHDMNKKRDVQVESIKKNMHESNIITNNVEDFMTQSAQNSLLKGETIKAKNSDDYKVGEFSNKKIPEPFSQEVSGLSERTHAIEQSNVFDSDFQAFNSNKTEKGIPKEQTAAQNNIVGTQQAHCYGSDVKTKHQSRNGTSEKISQENKPPSSGDIDKHPINLMERNSEHTLSITSELSVRGLMQTKLVELSEKFIENRDIYVKNRDSFESILRERNLKEPDLSSETPSRFISKLISIVVRKLNQVSLHQFSNFSNFFRLTTKANTASYFF